MLAAWRVWCCGFSLIAGALSSEDLDPQCALHIQADGAAIRSALVDHPAANAWRLGGGRAIQTRFGLPLTRFSSSWPDLGRLVFVDHATPEGLRAGLRFELGAHVEAVASTWPDELWPCRVDADSLLAGIDCVPAATTEPLAITVRPALLVEALGQAPAAVLRTLGLEYAAWSGRLVPQGFADRVDLPGFHPPLQAIDPAAVLDLPPDACFAMAMGWDGAKAAEYWHTWVTTAAFAASQDVYDTHCAADLGPLPALLQGLSGTITLCATPRPGFASLRLETPAGGDWDRLTMLVRDRLNLRPAADGSSEHWHGETGNFLAPKLHLSRQAGRWRWANEWTATVEPAADRQAPPWAQEWPTSPLAARLLVSETAVLVGRYCAATKRTAASDAQRRNLTFVQNFAQALAGSHWPAATLQTVADAHGLSGEGDTAIFVASAVGLCGFLPARLLANEVVRSRAARACTALAHVDPECCTAPSLLHDGPLSAPWLADEPWAVTTPLMDALPDLPALVSNPDLVFGTLIWRDHLGHETRLDGEAARRLWKTARALAATSAPAAPEAWAPCLAELRRLRFDSESIIEGDDNFRVFAMPKHLQRQAKPAGDWDILWLPTPDTCAVGIIAEALTHSDAEILQLLAKLALDRMENTEDFTLVSRRECSVDGVAGIRLCTTGRTGGLHLFFDRVLLAHRGWGYQLVSWSGQENPALATSVLDELCARFEISDRQRISPNFEPLLTINQLAPPGLPVDLDLSGSGWGVRPDAKAANAAAELALYHSASQTWAFLSAAESEGRVCSERARLAGMLSLIDQAYPDPLIRQEQRCHLAGGDGISVTFTRELESATHFQVRCSPCLGTTLMLATWTSNPGPASDQATSALADTLRPTTQRRFVIAPDTTAAVTAAIAGYLVHCELWVDAWPWAAAAARAFPSDNTHLAAALNVLNRQHRYGEALAWFREHATLAAADDLALASWEPWLLSHGNDRQGALTGYTKLFDRGLENYEDFAQYIALLRDQGDQDEVWRAFDRWPFYAKHSEVGRLRLRLLHEDGRDDEAKLWLQARYPGTDALSRTNLAEGFLELERPAEAHEILLAVLRSRPGLQRAWRLRGIAEHRLGRQREALESFRQALLLDPTDAQSISWCAAERGELGRGDGTALAQALTEVAISDPPQPDLSLPDRSETQWLLREDRVHWTSEQGLTYTQRRVILLADRAACEYFATLSLPFDPERETLYCHHIRVTPANGSTFDRLRRDDCYVVDDPNALGDGGGKLARMPVAGLSPGSILDWTVTRHESAADEPWLSLPLSSAWPIRLGVVSIAGEIAALTVASGQLEVVSHPDHLRIEVRDLPAVRGSAVTDPASRDLPSVRLARRNPGGWTTIAQEYLAELAPYLLPDPALADEMAAVRSTCGDGDLSAHLLAEVMQTLSYHAVLFGSRGRIPRPAAEVVDRAQGDCKDHSVVLRQLLLAAGIEAHLALVAADGDFDPTLTTLRQFDHMVVAVPQPDGTVRILDATADLSDPHLPVPAGLGSTQLLMLDPQQPRLVTAPAHELSTVRSERTVMPSPDGSLTINETVTCTGYFAQNLRSRFSGVAEQDRLAAARAFLGEQAASIEQVDLGELEQILRPATITLRWTPQARLQAQGDRLIGSLPEPWVEWTFRIAPEPMRTREVACLYPISVHARTHLAAPPGWTLTLAAPVAADDDEFHAWQGTCEASDWTVQVTQHPGRWPAARFADWQQRCASLCERATINIVLRRTP